LLILLIESALFLVAMALFVVGLASLRRADEPRSLRRDSFGND
jgi:hypothetical protein